MKKVILIRLWRNDKETLGVMLVLDEQNKVVLTLATLELAWKQNATGVSCIPAGDDYMLRPWQSPSKGKVYRVGHADGSQDVRGRKFVLIHVANFAKQLRGCIAVGMTQEDLNKDGLLDITSSRVAMDALFATLGDQKEVPMQIIEHIL